MTDIVHELCDQITYAFNTHVEASRKDPGGSMHTAPITYEGNFTTNLSVYTENSGKKNGPVSLVIKADADITSELRPDVPAGIPQIRACELARKMLKRDTRFTGKVLQILVKAADLEPETNQTRIDQRKPSPGHYITRVFGANNMLPHVHSQIDETGNKTIKRDPMLTVHVDRQLIVNYEDYPALRKAAEGLYERYQASLPPPEVEEPRDPNVITVGPPVDDRVSVIAVPNGRNGLRVINLYDDVGGPKEWRELRRDAITNLTLSVENGKWHITYYEAGNKKSCDRITVDPAVQAKLSPVLTDALKPSFSQRVVGGVRETIDMLKSDENSYRGR